MKTLFGGLSFKMVLHMVLNGLEIAFYAVVVFLILGFGAAYSIVVFHFPGTRVGIVVVYLLIAAVSAVVPWYCLYEDVYKEQKPKSETDEFDGYEQMSLFDV